MYIDELIELLATASGRFPLLGTDSAKGELRRAIEARRYDLQDEALIEAILQQDSRDLIESFTEAYGPMSDGFQDGEEAVKEAIRLYIASLEHMVNYYHTSLIGKHFSST